MGEPSMKIELNEWEINTILNVLGEQPYNNVACIIKHITEQVEADEKKVMTYDRPTDY